MPGLILPGRWRRQQQSPTGVDWTNPLTRGLVALINPGANEDAVGRTPLLINGTISKAPIRDTIATAASTNGGAHSVAGIATGVTTGALTDFLLVHDYAAVGGAVFLYGCGTYDGTNACGITVEHQGISNNWGAVDVGSNLAGSLASSGEALPSGLQFLVHSRDGTNHRFYRNGVLRNTVAGTSGNAGATARFCQNNLQQTTGTFSTVAKIALSGRYNRALSADEVEELSENYWQLLRSPPRRAFFGLGAGGPATYNVDQTDAATLADAVTSAAIFGSVQTDALTLAETEAGLAIFPVAQTDAASLTDSQSTSGATYAVSQSDALTLADSAGGLAVFASASSESITLADSPAALVAFASLQTDALTLADSHNASVGGGTVYDVSQSEALSLADVSTSLCVFPSALIEPAALADAVAATGIFGAAASDALSLAESASTDGALVVNARYLIIAKARRKSVVAAARDYTIARGN